MSQAFHEFTAMIAETRPLAGSYFGPCVAMKWDAWRVVRLLQAVLDRLALPPPHTVLDVGCGIGVYEQELRRRWPAARLVGTDLAAMNLDAARRGAADAAFLRCDAEQLPLADRSVDFAIAIEVLEHFLHPDRVVAELRRVIRPGGTLVVVVPLAPPVPFVRALSRLATRFIGSKVVEQGEFKEHMRIYDRRQLCREFAAGWRRQRLVTFNLMTFAVAAMEKLAPGWARSVTTHHFRSLDRLDILCGHLLYAKGLMVLERTTDP